MAILVIAEHTNAALAAATLNTVAAAAKMGGDIHLLVAGAACGAAAEAAAKVAGVSKVLLADNAAYANQLPENVAPLVAELGKNYSHVLAAATANGKNILPRVAALLDVDQISEIIAVESADTFKRPIYAGNAIATVQSSAAVKVITVRSTGFDAVAAEGGSAAIEAVSGSADAGKSAFVGEELAKSDRPELTAAKIVVSGGRGMQNGDNFKLLHALADKVGAAVGASRSSRSMPRALRSSASHTGSTSAASFPVSARCSRTARRTRIFRAPRRTFRRATRCSGAFATPDSST